MVALKPDDSNQLASFSTLMLLHGLSGLTRKLHRKTAEKFEVNCAKIDENCTKVVCLFLGCGAQIWSGF